MKNRRSASGLYVQLAALAISSSLAAVAHADVVGNTVGSAPSSGLSADFKRASKITLTVPATMTDLCAYLDGNGGAGGDQAIRLALYRDASGVPGSMVAQSPEYVVHAGDARQLRCTGVEWMSLSAGNYWIAILSGPTAGVARYFIDGTAQNWFANNDSYADGASNPFGAGNLGSGTIAAQLVYWPATELTLTGNAHVGTRPSGAMTADFSRASSFTMPQEGRVRFLRAYFDGNGGILANQRVRLAVYGDTGGNAPNPLLLETSEAVIPWGQKPAWLDFATSNRVLPPGKYWIAIHSGPTAGVGRYYLDGNAPNWVGSPDDYSDGAQEYFSSATRGEGTISAFVSYTPGPFTRVILGNLQRSIATTIPANTIRGSRFSFSGDNSVLSFVYTIIDGRGGALGSQDLRMAVYTDDHGVPSELVTQSDIVTVNAGWPETAQLFQIKARPLSAGTYWLMLQSGAGEGVARVYLTDAIANSVSATDGFANGPAELFGTESPDITPGSVTYAMFGEVSVPQR